MHDATEYVVDAWQRAILFWDVLRERGNQYLEHERSHKPPVLVFDQEMVLDGRTLPRPANYALAAHQARRQRSAHRREQAPVPGHRSARRPRTGHRRLQDRQRDRHRAQARTSLLLRDVLPAAGPRADHRIGVLGRDRLPAQGERAAPAGGGRPVPDRQLPGRLGADDAGRADPRRDRARSCWPARRCRTGRASSARTRCATPAACSAAPGRRRCWATSATASSTARTSSTTSRASTRPTPTGASSTTSTPRSTPSRPASCSSRSGGAATS